MIILDTKLPGVKRVLAEPRGDARGLFARLYCPVEFAAAGIDFTPRQVNLSTNLERGTLRGLHFQKPPHAEAKLVRAVRGRAWDVVVDLRPGPGFGSWLAEELAADRLNALLLPEGVAHGFLTLEAETDILYQMGRDHAPGHADGLPWDDAGLGIDWPFEPQVLSDADSGWAPLALRADLQNGAAAP
ncbi:MAG: dTDP-4-dehydrorhamnose 3,5-epimerase family protein [Pseudomonadota bacterium]